MMDIRPIRTEADYDWALAEIEPYFLSEPEPGSPEADRFEVLSTLIEAYETRTAEEIPAASPRAVLLYAIERLGRTQQELAEVLGSRSRASEVLSGKRRLTLEMVGLIAERWRLPVASLVQRAEKDLA